MLIFGRKLGQTIKVDGPCTIIVTKGRGVRIGVEAERQVRILRGELTPNPPKANKEASR